MPEAVHHGSQGDVVRRVQDALVARGYYVGTVDGSFGDRTDAAVRYFQSCTNININGVADAQVCDLLGVTDVDDRVHVQLSHEDITGPGTYPVHVQNTGGVAGEAEVVVWFQGTGGPLNERATVQLSEGHAATAEVPIPQEVIDAPGEYHLTVYVMGGPQGQLIGEETGVVHVRHQAAPH